ncbi:MAG: DUF4203 domain-containing protein [Christensenellales bacterium]
MELTVIAVLIGHLVLGIVFCFFGNRWLKIVLGVYGFALGFMLANALLPVFSSLGGTALLLASVGAGIAGAAFFVLLLYFGIFFIGFGGGMLLCLLAVSVLNLNIFNWYVYAAALFICCLLGALTLGYRHIFVAIFTSFIGASALAQFICQISTEINLQSLMATDLKAVYETYSSGLYLAALGGLFFAGLIVQLAVAGRAKR